MLFVIKSRFVATFLSPLLIASSVLAQNVATLTNEPSSTTITGPGPKTFDPSSAPSASDDAPKGNNNNDLNSSGLANYYFVFLALILCVVGACVFIVMRRRNLALKRRQNGHEEALEHSSGEPRLGGARSSGRYWQGGRRSAETSREEGLNEHGEAPPAYAPKRRSEEGQQSRQGGENGLAIPLQTLSREDAGLFNKPPDYSEAELEEVDLHERDPATSSSHDPHPRISP